MKTTEVTHLAKVRTFHIPLLYDAARLKQQDKGIEEPEPQREWWRGLGEKTTQLHEAWNARCNQFNPQSGGN